MTKAQSLAGYKICIDPGHGGHTGDDRQIFLPYGLVYWESEGDFETALHLDTLLTNLGANVLLTRTGNDDADDISLSARYTLANNFGADYFHSIHTNAANASANYTLVLFKGQTDVPASPQAKQMSDLMSPIIYSVMRTTAAYSRGDMTFLGYNLGVLNGATMPATLSEGSFHDVPLEGLRLKSSLYLKNYAWAVAKSFTSFYQKPGFLYGRVGGIVSEDFNDEAVNGIKVEVTTNDSVCYTDNNYNGIYALDLMPGSYVLKFSKEGYQTKEVNVTITANNYTKFDVEMIYFNDGKPRADFVVTGLPAGAGTQISFNGSNSRDVDGTIVKYEWNFGDNTAVAEGVTTTHTFATDNTYTVTLTVTDNEGKTGSISKDVLIKASPPANPTFTSVQDMGNNLVKLTWILNSEADAAYRIYGSTSDAMTDFTVLVNETTLTAGTNQYTLTNLASSANGYNFKITAVKGATESATSSDTYSQFSPADATLAKKVLIVDGYDRLGSWGKAIHAFANTYMASLRSQLPIISTAANEAVTSSTVTLSNYDMVVWFDGDESTTDMAFSPEEQTLIKTYLENGGKLLTTGSEIGWDLWEKGNATDRDFYNNYLKASFVGDGGSGRNPATGITETDFEGVTLNFGQVYPEDYPDEITAFTGAHDILTYANGQKSGIAYKGVFGSSANANAGIIYVSFPIESVSDKTAIANFMQKAFQYLLNDNTGIENISAYNIGIYPNPASDVLNLAFAEKMNLPTEISIWDISGRKIISVKNNVFEKGENLELNVKNLEKGIYILKIQNSQIQTSTKFVKE